MSDHIPDEVLFDYLDGELAASEHTRLEERMGDDAELRKRCEDLRTLMGDLGDLQEEREPERDLWPGIQARLKALDTDRRSAAPARERSDRKWSRTLQVPVSGLIAAGIALVLLSSGSVYFALRSGASADPASVATADPTVTAPAAATGPASFASTEGFRDYDRIVAELETIIEVGKDQLSPETVEVLEQSLAAVDAAIRDARNALEADPASGALSRLLSKHMKTKLDMLRRTAAAIQSNV